MTSGDSHARLDLIACRVIAMMDDLIAAMERAAEQIASGQSPQEIDVRKYQLYMASEAEGGGRAVVCIWDIEECFELISSAASEAGVCLEATTKLEVKLPAVEFGENMISGGFDTWKGISVDVCNDPLEELLDLVCEKLKERSLTLRCTDDEDMIIYLPVREKVS
jgi:hypothetical protein